MKEIWKSIPDYEGFYEISNAGRVRSKDRTIDGRWGSRIENGKIMACNKNRGGYKYTNLSRNGRRKIKYIHRLVAENFCKKGDGALEVDHINGDRSDNRSENLQWITRRDNALKGALSSRKEGVTSNYPGVTRDRARGLWKAQIRIGNKNKFIGRYKKEMEAAAAYAEFRNSNT